MLLLVVSGLLTLYGFLAAFFPIEIARVWSRVFISEHRLYNARVQKMLKLLHENPEEYERQYKDQVDMYRFTGAFALLLSMALWYIIITKLI